MGGGLFSGRSMQVAKWLGLVTAVWVQAISGNNYTFSNYSDALKTLMNLTQVELNSLSVAKDLGKAFGVVAGFFSDRLPTPVILLVGSLLGLLGYGAQWLVVSQTISPLPYWQMCVFLCMGGNSTTWMNTAVLVTCIRNFRRNRGPVSGILKGYVGLSTAIFTDLCSALFSASPSSILFMLAVVPGLVCVIAMPFLRELPEEQGEAQSAASAVAEEESEGRYFAIINGAAVVIAFYLLAFDLLGRRGGADDGSWISKAFALGLLLLLAAPIAIPIYMMFSRPSSDGDVAKSEEGRLRALLLGEEQQQQQKQKGAPPPHPAAEEEDRNGGRRPEIGEEHTIWEAAGTAEFWVLFWGFLCGVGTGMAVQNNMGQMGLAMGYADVSIFVSLTSISGFFGRIGSGSLSEYFLRRAATPRPLWNAASQILMTVGYAVMALALPGSLYIGSIVVGLCYGVRLAVTVPTASELFGLKRYGLIYNILILNLPLGSFLFSGLLGGLIYDAEATETAGGGNTCVGAHCYRLLFVLMAVTCLVGFALDVLLAFRTKALYRKIWLAKRTRKAAAAAS